MNTNLLQCQFVNNQEICKRVVMQGSDVRKQLYLPYACDSGDLRKLKIKQHMFLIIHNINSSPVHRYYHVILWQTGA